MDENGTIRVRVFTGRAQIPLEDATVAVTQNPRTAGTAWSPSASRESGKSTRSPSPPRRGGQHLAGRRGSALSVCDVWAEHPLYELLTVEDVQIFAGVETLQEMKLIPLPENTAPRDAAGEVRVTPQDL
ncbi:MAG: spore cortex-lytic protein [Anaerotruncus massiliensis (ex Togo et al. 2019)]